MLELLFVGGAIFLAVAFVVFIAKLLFSLVLIPIKIGFFLLKGLFVLLFIIPIAIISLGAFSFVVPVVLSICALPFILGVVGVVLFIKLFI